MEIPFEQLEEEISHLRSSGKRIAFCHGCFDVLHEGHLNLFKKAKEIGDVILVGVETDEYIKKEKGNDRPQYNLKERIKNVLTTNLVDFVFVIPHSDNSIYKDLYQLIQPQYLITANDEFLENKRRDAQELDIKLVVVEKNLIK